MDFATEVPLHALLGRMDSHLTVGLSTVVTEAAAHGVPSIACGREAPDFFRDEMSAGILVVAGTAAEILAALHRLLAQGRRLVSPSARRAPAALQRLLNGDLAPDSPGSPLRPA
jgi:glycosyltransferase involved in cell wall biosynthesis